MLSYGNSLNTSASLKLYLNTREKSFFDSMLKKREGLVICPSNPRPSWYCERRLLLKRIMSIRTSAKTNSGIYCVYKTREECVSYLTSRFP